MQPKITLLKNTISPSLRRAAAGLKDKRPVLRAMAVYTVQHAKRAFNEPGLRPSPWPNLASGAPARLRKNNVLARSPRVVSVTARSALVGSDRRYAAIHQLGGRTKPRTIRPRKAGGALHWPGAPHPVKKVDHPGSKIPARPYWPFTGKGQKPSAKYVRSLNPVVKKAIDRALGL